MMSSVTVSKLLLPLAAWAFGSSAMLFWGFAALLPIVIHLWSRRKYQRVSWAAMEYLLLAVQKHARRIRLEQWLLLSLRVLILLFLALAVADPVISWLAAPSEASQGRPPRHFVLVIDGSFSMGAEHQGVSRFEAAKVIAERWIRSARQGDGFTLVLMTNPPQIVIRAPAFDVEDVTRELKDLQLPHGMANLESTLTEVEQLVEQVRRDQPRLEETVIGIFTDLGKTTWQVAADRRVAVRLEQLAKGSRFQVIDVGSQEVANVAITRCQLVPDWVTVQQEVPWEAEIRNYSDQAMNGQQIEFWVDGHRVYYEAVDLEPGGQVAVGHRVRFQTPGEHQIEVRTTGDGLEIDNRRWSSVRVRKSLEVLCVEGRPGAARYVDLSLNPGNARQPRIRPEVVSESGLLERDLTRYTAVFFCNVGRFSSEEANVLFDYLQQAGTVVFFLGDQVQIADYNESLGAGQGARRVLPVQLMESAETASYRFDPLGYRHPIISPFRGQVRSGLLTSPIARYIRTQPYTEQHQAAPTVALQFLNADPAIVEERIGRGRSIVFTMAASAQSVDASADPPVPWSDLGTWPSFLPLIQETLALAVRNQDQTRNVQVGQVLEISPHQAVKAGRVEVINPRGESEHVAVTSSEDRVTCWYEQTLFRGMYEARYGAPVDQSQWFAANVDILESDLSRSDPDLLSVSVDLPSEDRPTTAEISAPATGRPIYRYILACLLGLLFAESLYACYLGRASG